MPRPIRSIPGNRHRPSAGTTLVEVLAGLALLAVLLTTILLLKTRFAQQARLADRRQQAVEAADVLLSDWWRDRAHFPRQADGQLDGGFVWHTRPLPDETAAALGGQIVRFEVAEAQNTNTNDLVQVDILLPDEEQELSPVPTAGRSGQSGQSGRSIPPR